MKKIILLFPVVAIMILAPHDTIAAKRKVRHDMKVLLSPKILNLTERNGMVDINFIITVPAHYVQSKHQYIFTPVLTDFDNALPLTSVIIDGERYAKMASRNGHSRYMKDKMSYAPDMSNATNLRASQNNRIINYELTVPYEPWMRNASLVTLQRFNSRRTTVLVAEDIYAQGVKSSPRATSKKQTVQEKVVRVMEGKVKINFPISSSVIDLNLDNNIRELYNLKELLSKTMNNKDIVIDSVNIIASSSPDGYWAANKKLAENRAMSVKRYLHNNLNLSPEMGAKIRISCIAENWEGLASYITESDMPNKQRALNAIAISNLQQRERAMMQLPEYPYIKQYILPQLRFVKYQIFYHSTNTPSVVKGTGTKGKGTKGTGMKGSGAKGTGMKDANCTEPLVCSGAPQTVTRTGAQPRMSGASAMQGTTTRGMIISRSGMSTNDRRSTFKDRSRRHREVVKYKVSPHYLRYRR